MNCTKVFSLFFSKFCLAVAASMLLTVETASATTVRVFTSLGDFSIELFDDVTPITVANFLNYVNSGRYNGTVIHRAIVEPTPFIIQGGWLTYNDETNRLDTITTDAAIQNEPFISNTRGMVSMAKLPGNPNSATSQWFVNLNDNSANLDGQNGGFTAFGRVIGDGMTVVDSIAALQTFTIQGVENFPGGVSDFPLINVTGGSVSTENFVNIAVAVEAPNYFDESSGLLRVSVDAGESGRARLAFSVTSTEPSVVVKLELDSVETLAVTADDMATFDAVTGRLILPELFVAGAVAFRNVTFVLTDPIQFLFALESFEDI